MEKYINEVTFLKEIPKPFYYFYQQEKMSEKRTVNERKNH